MSLLGQRIHEHRVAMAEANCRGSTEEVEVLAAGVVPEARAFATDGEQRHAPPRLHEVLRFFFAPVSHLSNLFVSQDNRLPSAFSETSLTPRSVDAATGTA